MQYDSTCMDVKCWVECQAEARGFAGEMITISWTLARLLEMHSAKNSVGRWLAMRCSGHTETLIGERMALEACCWGKLQWFWRPRSTRDDSAGEANTDTVPRFCFKERNHGSGIGIIDLASNSKEQPLLLGRYSLALSTPLGIYSLALSTLLGSVCPETNAWGSTVVRTCWGLKNPTLWSALQG